MKCKKCGRTIGVEDKLCPYCQTVNDLAAAHEQNIKEFDKEFSKTQSEVTGSAQKLEGLGIRAVILAVLVTAILVMHFVTKRNYHGPDMDAIRSRDAQTHREEYKKELDGYLESGEYLDYIAFIHAHGIYLSDEGYEDLRHINYVASDYYECIRHMQGIIYQTTDKEYWNSMDLQISHFSMYLEGFMETYKVQAEAEKNSTYKAYMEDMYQNLRYLLKAYMKLDDAGVDEFLELSKAKMAVRLEEVFVDETEQDTEDDL